jgi:hypothetical protein
VDRFTSVSSCEALEKAKTPPVVDGVFALGFLKVEVQLKLCWMWTQANIVNLLLALEINPCVDQILSKDATLK